MHIPRASAKGLGKHHAWTPPVCQALICDGVKVKIAAMHPDFAVRRKPAVPDGICWSGSHQICVLSRTPVFSDFPDHGLTCSAIT
ncbi:protein of unknown function (plasmid) [Caballeronia sp. S22]